MAVKLNEGTWGPDVEVLDWVMYDRFALLAATQEHILFNLQEGGTRAGAALTAADTNNIGGVPLPIYNKFTIWEITVQYQAIALRNNAALQLVLDLWRQTIVRFLINGKDEMFRLPLYYFASAFQFTLVPTVAGDNITPPGLATYEGIFKMKIPIVLQMQTPWEMRVQLIAASGGGLDGDLIDFMLRGELDRRH